MSSFLDSFRDPPPEYRLQPIWLWNATPDAAEVERQVREMHAKGVGGFFFSLPGEAASDPHWLGCVKRACETAVELGLHAATDVEIPAGGAETGVHVSPPILDMSEHEHLLRAKLMSSLVHTRRENRVPFEVFGDADWGLSLHDMKRAVDRLACLGINRIIPNAFHYGAPARDQRPVSQFFQATYWPHYGLFADYAARLSYALSQGRHGAQIAVLSPRTEALRKSELSKFTRTYLNVLVAHLLGEHLDYDVLDEESIRQATAVDQRLRVADEEYELLILPPVSAMGCHTAVKIKEFVEDGGKLFGTGFLPVEDADGDKHERVRSIFAGLFGVDPVQVLEGVRTGAQTPCAGPGPTDGSVFLFSSRQPRDLVPMLRALISKAIRPEVSAGSRGGECPDIGCVHRVLGDAELFFFANHAAQPREVQLSMRCSRAPYRLDLETGDAVALPNCTQRGDRTLLLHRFEAHASLVVHFGDEPALVVGRPGREAEGAEVALAREWEFSTDEPAAPRRRITDGSWTDQGLPHYSGAGTYAQTVDVPRIEPGRRVFLRAVDPADIVEFMVNGRSAGVRAWPPFEVEITHLLRPGPNRIEIKVTNSLANALCSEPRPSGLLGGARVVIW